MCHDNIILYACGHPKHILPDPCRRIVLTNICAGLVREVEVLVRPCVLCIGNVRKFREITGRSIPVQVEHRKANGDEGGEEEPWKINDDKEGVDDGEDYHEASEYREAQEVKGVFRSFEKKCYTDEDFEELRKECQKRVWSRCYDD